MMRMPAVTRVKGGGINWTPDLLDWLQASIAAGVPVKALAMDIGCSTQSIYTCCTKYNINKPVRIEEQPDAKADFATLMAGRRFEDMPVRRTKSPGWMPVGPITRIIPRRTVGRALDLGGL
ncbi:hypothetical protein [Novispirillum itersonii]|uniref:hypothetical protein n=1 Tax=Novispirillum itersonii TaxID=189 RepID=UPI0003A4D194|nr:hypothetical protein [Novispirillum itersonii]